MDTNDEQNERMTLADASRPGFGRKPAPGYEVAVPAEPEAAPLYRVKHRCFLHNRLYEPGEEVRFEGKPGRAHAGAWQRPDPHRQVRDLMWRRSPTSATWRWAASATAPC
jgi:hypothetical protein